jgi:hypothetical protein
MLFSKVGGFSCRYQQLFPYSAAGGGSPVRLLGWAQGGAGDIAVPHQNTADMSQNLMKYLLFSPRDLSIFISLKKEHL